MLQELRQPLKRRRNISNLFVKSTFFAGKGEDWNAGMLDGNYANIAIEVQDYITLFLNPKKFMIYLFCCYLWWHVLVCTSNY